MTLRTAVILCGGKGSRLGSLAKKIPKTLVKIQNYPILWFIINSLKKNNFNHFILPIGYKGEQIKKYMLTSDFSPDHKHLRIPGLKSVKVFPGANTTVPCKWHL